MSNYPRIDRPTEPGKHYWFKPRDYSWEVIFFNYAGLVVWHGTSEQVKPDRLNGVWAGPLPLP